MTTSRNSDHSIKYSSRPMADLSVGLRCYPLPPHPPPPPRAHTAPPRPSPSHHPLSLPVVSPPQYAVTLSKEHMGEEKLAEVVEFHRRENLRLAKEEAKAEAADEGDVMKQALAMWETPFMPNLLNTCVFLVETAQQVAVLLVNYKGRPWMKGVTENHALFLSVVACVAGCAACAWGVFPKLNEMIHLEPFPDDDFRFRVMGLVAASLAGTFIWDRICVRLFAPEIFKAMASEAAALSIADLLPALMNLGKVFVVLTLLGSGNIVLMGLAYYAWKKYKEQMAEMQREEDKRNGQ